jgi:hypothetical protein
MKKYTQKELRRLVDLGVALNITKSHNREDLGERYEQVGYSKGIYGCNGKLLQGESGQMYAIIGATSALYIF